MLRHIVIVLGIAVLIALPPLGFIHGWQFPLPLASIVDPEEEVPESFRLWEREGEILRTSTRLVLQGSSLFLEFHGYARGLDKTYVIEDMGKRAEAAEKVALANQALPEHLVPTFDQLPRGNKIYEGRQKYVSVQGNNVYQISVLSADGSVFATKLFFVPAGWKREGSVKTSYDGQAVSGAWTGQVREDNVVLSWNNVHAAYYRVKLNGKEFFVSKPEFRPDSWEQLVPKPAVLTYEVCAIDEWGNAGGCSTGNALDVDVERPSEYSVNTPPGVYQKGTVVRFSTLNAGDRLYYSTETSEGRSPYVSSYQQHRLEEDTVFRFYLVDELQRFSDVMQLQYTVSEE